MHVGEGVKHNIRIRSKYSKLKILGGLVVSQLEINKNTIVASISKPLT